MKNKPLKIFALVICIYFIPQCGLLPQENRNDELIYQSINYLAELQAMYFQNWVNGYISTLNTLANIMSYYENIPINERRERFDSILQAIIMAEPNIINLFTVWKPNALDGMDAQFIGRTGSTPTGQYAAAFDRTGGNIIFTTSSFVNDSMQHMTSPDSRRDNVDDPLPITLNGRNTLSIRIMVPVINPRTSEVIAIAGCLLDLSAIQNSFENILRNRAEIAAINLYSGNSTIIGSLIPSQIGMKLSSGHNFFGEHIQNAEQAVLKGMNFYCKAYSAILAVNLEIFMIPFLIGNSNATWTVMIAVSENYFRRQR